MTLNPDGIEGNFYNQWVIITIIGAIILQHLGNQAMVCGGINTKHWLGNGRWGNARAPYFQASMGSQVCHKISPLWEKYIMVEIVVPAKCPQCLCPVEDKQHILKCLETLAVSPGMIKP